MTFELQKSIEVLRRTPSVLTALLDGLDDSWVFSNYGERTFSPFDVVGHLIHADQVNWMMRLRIILEHGETVTFPPFDRYAMVEANQGKSMAELLETFASIRSRNLADLISLNLTPEQLELCGDHPQFGRATLKQLLASWVVHDLGHTHQIAKAMAFQYRDDVGPWRQYLTILPQG
jgi:hypothetical protein